MLARKSERIVPIAAASYTLVYLIMILTDDFEMVLCRIVMIQFLENQLEVIKRCKTVRVRKVAKAIAINGFRKKHETDLNEE